MKENLKIDKGITLIALIITIIILVILAAVSIRAVYEMGIVGYAINGTQQYAERAKEENAMLDETGRRIEDAVSKVKEIQGGNGGTTTPTTPTNPSEPETPVGQKGPTGKPLVNSETVSDYVTGTEPLKGEDRYGNPITIPVGFKVASDSGEDVTKGIVIEDNDLYEYTDGTKRGNQYVWIPTGTIHTDTTMTAANDKIIIAGRYEFADGTKNYTNEAGTTTTTAPAKGTPILKQSLANYATQPTNITYHSTSSAPYHGIDSATNGEIVISSYYYEVSEYREGIANSNTTGLNRTAKNLQGFASSVASNGGYYIARYEASWGTGDKVKSRKTEITPLTSAGTRTNGQLWNFVTEIDAAGFCQGLYSGINSDLMNSYAWDTAIVYMQTFDTRTGNVTPYSYQNRTKSSSNPLNAGESEDEVCKINDMASNCYEWTTEYSTYQVSSNAVPCVDRGGSYNSTGIYAASRYRSDATYSNKSYTFRPTLYL